MGFEWSGNSGYTLTKRGRQSPSILGFRDLDAVNKRDQHLGSRGSTLCFGHGPMKDKALSHVSQLVSYTARIAGMLHHIALYD